MEEQHHSFKVDSAKNAKVTVMKVFELAWAAYWMIMVKWEVVSGPD